MLCRQLVIAPLVLIAALACGPESDKPEAAGGASVAGASAAAAGASTSEENGGASASNQGGGSAATAGGAGDGAGEASGGLANTGNGGSMANGGAAANGGQASGGAGHGGVNGGAASGGAAGSGGTVTMTPGIRFIGRSAAGTNGSMRFSWSGSAISARFSGTSVSMNLNDGKNRFTVVVDGGTPKTVTSTSGQASLPLATGLSAGTHELLVWRNTEASIGVSDFQGLSGFGTGGALLAPSAAPDRRIEVIGDSLSAGAGVEGTSTNCNPGIDAFTNNYLAYGSVAARTVNADVVTIAWSGIGVYRNYSGNGPTMPARYDYAVPNDSSAWDFSKYQPQVVVINLGTNDFGSGNPGQPYVDAYVAFAQHVRSKYTAANFVLIDMYGGDRATAIKNVISALNKAGESKVEMLSFSSVPKNNTACNSHPNTAAQKAMGDILSTRLKTLMSW